ncbi:MAG TPA: helix-turn-helix transcriptional regulator, partial [Planctomycetota bacterium]|nr:helix-turn-helix transcriptional regulator [Planctomycetota bacterium]
WMRRAHLTLSAQLLFHETIGWALRTLSEDAAYAGLRVPDDADPRILNLLRELENGPPERPSVDELARRAHMGLTAFRDAFQKATGRPPRQYLEERRIERAARALVETNRKLYEIAEAEGYDDPYHFSRIFRRVMGVSPRQYRRSSQSGCVGVDAKIKMLYRCTSR